MDKIEQAHADAVASDMDLMFMARAYTDNGDSVPKDQVLAEVHEKHPGGISQFYLNNRF